MPTLSTSGILGPRGGVLVRTFKTRERTLSRELNLLLGARHTAKRQDKKFYDRAIFWLEWVVEICSWRHRG